MLALLIAMALGYAASVASGLLNWSDLAGFGPTPLFAVPRLDHLHFTFSAALAVPFAIAAWASTAKTIGLLGQCQKLNDSAWREPDMDLMRRGVLADGLATVLSGVVGTLGVNTMPSAVAVPAATGLASRRVAYAIAVVFVVMAFLPAISVALASMPKPVMGGITLFSGCLVMINGLQTMASCQMDQKRTVVIGLGLIAGLAAEKYPHLAVGMPFWLQAMTNSSLVFGTVVAMIANLLLVQAPLWVGTARSGWTLARSGLRLEASLASTRPATALTGRLRCPSRRRSWHVSWRSAINRICKDIGLNTNWRAVGKLDGPPIATPA